MTDAGLPISPGLPAVYLTVYLSAAPASVGGGGITSEGRLDKGESQGLKTKAVDWSYADLAGQGSLWYVSREPEGTSEEGN